MSIKNSSHQEKQKEKTELKAMNGTINEMNVPTDYEMGEAFRSLQNLLDNGTIWQNARVVVRFYAVVYKVKELTIATGWNIEETKKLKNGHNKYFCVQKRIVNCADNMTPVFQNIDFKKIFT